MFGVLAGQTIISLILAADDLGLLATRNNPGVTATSSTSISYKEQPSQEDWEDMLGILQTCVCTRTRPLSLFASKSHAFSPQTGGREWARCP